MNFQESVNYSRSSSTTPISSLRPRTRRKISGLEEGETLFAAEGFNSNARSSSTPFDSPTDSRSSSPAVPNQRHPSRRVNATSNSMKQSFHEDLDSSLSSSSSNAFNSQDPLGSLSDLWGNSWTTIQGLASNVLGSNDPSARYTQQRPREGASGNARRLPAKATLRSWAAAAHSFPSSDWSSADRSAEGRIGAGSQEERDALVRARKRQDLLTSGGLSGDDMAGYQNAAGVFKRRVSDDRGDGTLSSSSAPPPESEDRDALAYLHHVQVNDTLAGISIKYNCSSVVVRKANRMWPNDSVQIRKMMMIPVDSCTVKGKKVPDPIPERENGVKRTFMEDDGGGDENMNDNMNNKITIPSDTISTTTSTVAAANTINSAKRMDSLSLRTSDINDLHCPTSSDVSSQASNPEPPWRHDSWVLLPNSSTPTQIVRLPRRALGFFPPARRKSVTFSDSSAITPRASFDIQNSSFSPSTPPTSNHVLASTTVSASATGLSDYFGSASAATLLPSNRDRSHSNTSSSTSAAAVPTAASPLRSVTTNPSHPSSYALRGPGGVGTLGKSVRAPGPAQDGLNKLFGPHLPNVAPPSNSPSVPWITEEETDPNGAGASASMYGSSPGFDLENVGGAIEGWMRRMATQASRAANALADSNSMSSSSATAKNSGMAGLAGLSSLGINNRSSSNNNSGAQRNNGQSEGRSRGRNYSGGSNGDFGVGMGTGSGSSSGRGRAVAGDLIELTDSLELSGGSGSVVSGGNSSSRLNPGGDASGAVNDGSERLRGRLVGSLPSRGFSPANAKGRKGD